MIELLVPYISLAGGLAALILCGNWLVTGSIQLARYFKLSTLVVGLTIVAFATSAPELFVSVRAAFEKAPGIALGNVIGSNISNIALVVALTALIYPIFIRNKSIGFDLIVMFIAAALLFLLGINGTLGHIEGICLVTLLLFYILFSIYKEKRKTQGEEIPDASMKPYFAALFIATSVLGLYFGSGWFVNGARAIAMMWGVSERVIGISVVALGTSMPELVTSLIAAVRKEADLSVGNIIGSNIFNITLVLGTTAIINPLNTGDRTVFTQDMIWVFGISVALLLAMLPLSNGKISRWKGGVLLLMYGIYIFTLFS